MLIMVIPVSKDKQRIQIDNRFNCPKASKGSITLEMSICLSIFLIVVYFMISAISAYKIEVAAEAALDNTAAEISLILPLAEKSFDNNNLSWLQEENLKSIIEESTGEELISSLASNYISDLISSVVFAGLIEQRMRYWLEDSAGGQKINLLKLESIDIALNSIANCNLIIIEARIEIAVLTGSMTKQIRSAIAVWTGSKRDGSDEDELDNDLKDDIWNLDNFSRGRKIRELFGANLPASYPLIARFSEGQATVIRSMDLTAPSYSDPDNAIAKAADDLAKLSNYKGHTSNRENWPDILPEDIIKKEYHLIVPDNSDPEVVAVLESNIRNIADHEFISVKITKYMDSSRYNNDLTAGG
ncbi:MAG: hypothetical protein PWP10_3308 [Clostridiales bacterium]|nr:hypothetical protein [Clostridiales bacterium]